MRELQPGAYNSVEMQYQDISIRVPSEIATAFRSASDDERILAIRVFAGFLKPRSRGKAVKAFDEARQRMSGEAKASGLTQAKLDEILAEEA